MNFSDKYVEVITQADIEAEEERKRQLKIAMAAVDWAYKGKCVRVVRDWTNNKVGIISGNERIL